jgi:hypothetical protein
MANTLKVKRSSTANATPTGLQAGELAVNTTDKRLFVGDGTNTQELTRRAASSTTGRVQLAASTGALTDSGGLHFDSTNNTLTVSTVLVQSTATEGVVSNNANPSKPMVLTHSNIADGGEIIIGDYFEDGNGTAITINDTETKVSVQGVLTSLEGMQTVQLQLLDGDYSHSVNLVAPLTVSSTYTLTLPSTAGSNDQVLTTNGSGTLSWTEKGGFTPVTQTYTTAGTTTYTIPSGATRMRIRCVGGGGGGGGGRCGAYLSGRGGGGGGAGASWSEMTYAIADIGTAGSTVLSITVGAGGTAGAGQTVNLNNGGAGGQGGETSVSRNSDSVMLCRASGGSGGGGGQSSSPGSGAVITNFPAMWVGGAGSSGNLNSNVSDGSQTPTGPAGGGGGGGVPSTATGEKAGGRGPRTAGIHNSTLFANGGAASSAGTGGNGENAIEYLPGTVGGGGGGGGGSNSGKGGNGGNGFRGGGGGGGGAGTADAGAGGSGAGGTGGDGYVRLEFW